MTNTRLSLLLALPLVLLAGCAKDIEETQAGGGGIDFTIAFAGEAGPQTRVSIDEAFANAWEDGDRIGVFAVAGDTKHIVNVPLTYDGQENTWSASPLYWPQGVASLDFHAYYPYDEDYDDIADINDFRVASDQTGGGFESSVVMTASKPGVTKAAPTVALTFGHAAALVQLTVNDAAVMFDPDPATPITVTLRGVKPAPGDTSVEAVDVSMHRVATTDPDAIIFRALVAPQTLAEGKRMFRIEQGAVALQSSALTGAVTLSAGRVTKFTQSSPLTAIGSATFTDGSTDTAYGTVAPDGTHKLMFDGDGTNTVYSVEINGKTHLIGRRDDETVTLKLDADGNLQFRDPVDDGSGTPKIPIGTYAEFAMINTGFAGHRDYLQEADLDLLGDASLGDLRRNWVPIGSSTTPFPGSYDGGGHTVAGLYINTTNSYVGLFGIVSSGGSLSRIGIVSGEVTGDYDVGGVCGLNSSSSSTITDCYNMAAVSGEYGVGGVCGFSHGAITNCRNTGKVTGATDVGGVCGFSYGAITDCYNTGEVTGATDVGGLIGDNRGAITDCYNTGEVTGTGNNVGGVCGYNNGGAINECYNEGTVTETGTGFYVGGVCGISYDGTISDCYNTGEVTGATDVGGVCGYNYDGIITDCHNTGAVSGDYGVGGVCSQSFNGAITACDNEGTVTGTEFEVGGVCGFSYGAAITDCYNTGTVTGADDVGGLIGDNRGTISASHNSGMVSGAANVGGVCGWNESSAINDCYNTGEVSGTYEVGGVCGNNNSCDLTDCYNTGEVTGTESNVGGVCGNIKGGTINECYNKGAVEGEERVGGVCGWNSSSSSTITDCYNTGTVTGTNDVGGLIGENEGAITGCHNSGKVSGAGNYVGGLIGDNSGAITACHNTGTVTGTGTGSDSIGGVIGDNSGAITACHNTGTVTGTGTGSDSIGGVIGFNAVAGTITACYNEGKVSGAITGGLIGDNRGAITASYNKGEVSGTTMVGGVCGMNSAGTITACYFLQYDGQQGVGSATVVTGVTPFGDGSNGTGWPAATDASGGWAIYDGTNGYWKDLGSWNSGDNGTGISGAASVFPRLWWEEE